MTTKTAYISPETIEKIKNTAIIDEVIADYVDLKKSGSSLVGKCPCCNSNKLTVTPAKKIWKCFVCGEAGKDGVSFLTKGQGMTFVEAMNTLAKKYNISINDSEKKKKPKSKNRKLSFRNQQLKESGIPVKAQKYFLQKSESAKVESDRYQAGTIDKSWNVIPGDDMILHYLDLEGKPLMYKNQRGKKVPLIRVRRANPSVHLDKNGKEKKYESPWKSGSHLWFPMFILQAFKSSMIIEALYICEGEKKADKMCLEGLPAVGIMGIHNFGRDGQMPASFELLIKRCSIKKVVFVLDSDWQDISIKPGRPVDFRPKLFSTAIIKYKKYFAAYANSGVFIDIYFAAGLNTAYKGIDDLLVRELKGKEEELKEDFEKAIIDRKGEGKHVQVYNITSLSDYQIKEFWQLHSIKAFIEKHKEELKKLKEFTVGRLKRRYDEESKEFELAQALLPHEEFWTIRRWEDRKGNEREKYEFNYTNMIEFLSNRGFCRYEYDKDKYRLIHIENKIVREISHVKIRDFVINFMREVDKPNVLELLYRGGEQYLGPKKLNDLHLRSPQFNESEKDCMFLYFKNCYWKITSDKIESRPLSEIPKPIWESKVNDFEPTYLGEPMCQVEKEGEEWKLKISEAMRKSDIANFYSRTSMFHWQKKQELQKDEKGIKKWVNKAVEDPISKDELKIWKTNLVSKMLAAGYVLHDYLDYGNLKAIVCLDGLESEVGKSQGGTGKSVFAKQFEYLVPVEVIDGKKKNIEDDSFIYESVDERTHVILFDDVRVNFKFEFLFSHITTGIKVNRKGEHRFKVKPKKIIITTNHALNGSDDSHERRQYNIAFSNYYNLYRSIGDEFGHQFFHEWGKDQWNLFYNWMANCIQTYLKHGLVQTTNKKDIIRRKLRQEIGENFLDWASLMFLSTTDQKGLLLNTRFEKVFAMEKYLEEFQRDRRYMDAKVFKEKLQKYAIYAKLDFNPQKNGQRISSNGKEFFTLADDGFDINDHRTIMSGLDLIQPNNDLPY